MDTSPAGPVVRQEATPGRVPAVVASLSPTVGGLVVTNR